MAKREDPRITLITIRAGVWTAQDSKHVVTGASREIALMNLDVARLETACWELKAFRPAVKEGRGE